MLVPHAVLPLAQVAHARSREDPKGKVGASR